MSLNNWYDLLGHVSTLSRMGRRELVVEMQVEGVYPEYATTVKGLSERL